VTPAAGNAPVPAGADADSPPRVPSAIEAGDARPPIPQPMSAPPAAAPPATDLDAATPSELWTAILRDDRFSRAPWLQALELATIEGDTWRLRPRPGQRRQLNLATEARLRHVGEAIRDRIGRHVRLVVEDVPDEPRPQPAASADDAPRPETRERPQTRGDVTPEAYREAMKLPAVQAASSLFDITIESITPRSAPTEPELPPPPPDADHPSPSPGDPGSPDPAEGRDADEET